MVGRNVLERALKQNHAAMDHAKVMIRNNEMRVLWLASIV